MKVKVSPLQAMKAHREYGCKGPHKFYTAMAPGMLGHPYPWRKHPVLILEETEWTPGPVWTQRSEKKISNTRAVQPVAKRLVV